MSSTTKAVPIIGDGKICLNCRHWRDKAWVDKGWGICDNPKNEVYVGTSLIHQYVTDAREVEELTTMIEDGIRYPEDFGCIFFENIEK